MFFHEVDSMWIDKVSFKQELDIKTTLTGYTAKLMLVIFARQVLNSSK